MRKNVSYTRCVCDICKAETDVSMSLSLPNKWEHIKISVWTELDLCETCTNQFYRLVDKLKDGEIFMVDLGCAEGDAE